MDAVHERAVPSSGTGERPMMEADRRQDALTRLAKTAGQVQGTSRMIEANRYCVDVLTQIAAAQKALDGAARIITRNYLERCVTNAITGRRPIDLRRGDAGHRSPTLALGSSDQAPIDALAGDRWIYGPHSRRIAPCPP